jgi:hypothetical protein
MVREKLPRLDKKTFVVWDEKIFQNYFLFSSNEILPIEITQIIFIFQFIEKKSFENKKEFDKKGILYWLGTLGLKEEYKHPSWLQLVRCLPSPISEGIINSPTARL